MTKYEPIGYLVTRKGHSIPLAGLSPKSIKESARNWIRGDKEKFGHQKALSAIINRLGFSGNPTEYKERHYPCIEQLLSTHDCRQQGELFPRNDDGCIDLFIRDSFINGRRLADRLFNSDKPWPPRVFLGYGVNWSVWDQGNGRTPPTRAIATIGGNPTTAVKRAERLWEYRVELKDEWNFLGNALFGDTDASELVCPLLSFKQNDEQIKRNIERSRLRREAFFAVFGDQPEGWVDIIKVTDNLAILKGCDGTWQPLWKGYRDNPPPDFNRIETAYNLHKDDIPSILTYDIRYSFDSLIEQKLYNRPDVWEHREALQARQHFTDIGNSVDAFRHATDIEVRAEYLRKIKVLPEKKPTTIVKEIPLGFKVIDTDSGEKVALSSPITISEYKLMLEDSGYLERRYSEADEFQWLEESNNSKEHYPACVCWLDAQAYCRWFEDKHNLNARLPIFEELVSFRPCYSYNMIQRSNAGKSESQPFFKGLGNQFNWQEDIATWKSHLAPTEYNGISFYDSDDLYEFCQHDCHIIGRTYHQPIQPHSDGRYKQMQVMFRIAISLDGDAVEVTHG